MRLRRHPPDRCAHANPPGNLSKDREWTESPVSGLDGKRRCSALSEAPARTMQSVGCPKAVLRQGLVRRDSKTLILKVKKGNQMSDTIQTVWYSRVTKGGHFHYGRHGLERPHEVSARITPRGVWVAAAREMPPRSLHVDRGNQRGTFPRGNMTG